MDALLPPLNRLLHSQHTRDLLERHGVTSTATLAMLSKDELRGNFEFITDADVNSIAAGMRRPGAQQREYGEDASAFLRRVFGSEAHAPAGVLHVAMVRHMTVTRAVLAPLQLVKLLEQADPDATVGDAMRLGESEAKALASEVAEQGDATLRCDDPRQDLLHLKFRLRSIRRASR